MDDIPETRYAKTQDGVHIAYQVAGDGPIDLVFVPDWVSHIEWAWEYPPFARMLRRLASFTRLIWFDKRGLGLSDRPDRLPLLEDQMADIAAVMDAAGSERAVLFGATDGTAMSVAFAASHPERVIALVTYGAIPRILRDADYAFGFTEQSMAFYMNWVEDHWGKDDPDYIGLFAPTMLEDSSFRKWHSQLCRLSASPAAIVEVLRVWALHDVRAILPNVRVPTLVVNRSDDGRMDAARYMVEHIPGSTLVEVAGRDSLIYAGDTDAVIDEVQEFLTGMRDAPDTDRILATVLFTDIVGSTGLAATLGDRRWNELLDAYEATANRQLSRFRGTKVKSTGDGMLAIFDGPARAIRCAQATIAASRAMSLDLRAGLHTGEVDLRGDDIGGIGVHLGARVAGLAAIGEVLVSRTVTDLVAGSGITFQDRGEHELRGVPGTWRLFAVVD